MSLLLETWKIETNLLLYFNFNEFRLPYIGGGEIWAQAQIFPVREVMRGGEGAHPCPRKPPPFNYVDPHYFVKYRNKGDGNQASSRPTPALKISLCQYCVIFKISYPYFYCFPRYLIKKIWSILVFYGPLKALILIINKCILCILCAFHASKDDFMCIVLVFPNYHIWCPVSYTHFTKSKILHIWCGNRIKRADTLFYNNVFRITLCRHYSENGKIYINVLGILGKLPVFL